VSHDVKQGSSLKQLSGVKMSQVVEALVRQIDAILNLCEKLGRSAVINRISKLGRKNKASLIPKTSSRAVEGKISNIS
jgi:hypothetical protein